MCDWLTHYVQWDNSNSFSTIGNCYFMFVYSSFIFLSRARKGEGELGTQPAKFYPRKPYYFLQYFQINVWLERKCATCRCSGLTESDELWTMDSRSSRLAGICLLLYWTRYFIFPVQLLTQENKWVPLLSGKLDNECGKVVAGGGWTSVPTRGGEKTPSCFTLRKKELRATTLWNVLQVCFYIRVNVFDLREQILYPLCR